MFTAALPLLFGYQGIASLVILLEDWVVMLGEFFRDDFVDPSIVITISGQVAVGHFFSADFLFQV